MNLFDETIGGSRKGVAFVRRMMRNTKEQHDGEYRKPPAKPFRYDKKHPSGWSEHIQDIFKPDGAEIVKYKRPPKRTKTDAEKKYDEVHKWDYWGLKEKDLKYNEARRRWVIKDTNYTFPPIPWTDPRDGRVYWGLPHYTSQDKGVHYDRMAFKEDDFPKIPFFSFSKSYGYKLYNANENLPRGERIKTEYANTFFYPYETFETPGTIELRSTNAVIPATGRNDRDNVFRR